MLNPSDTSQKEPKVLRAWTHNDTQIELRDEDGEPVCYELFEGSWHRIRAHVAVRELARILTELSTAQERAERAEQHRDNLILAAEATLRWLSDTNACQGWLRLAIDNNEEPPPHAV